MAPAGFRLPRRVEGGWIVGGFHHEENPLHTTPRWATGLVEHWARMRALSRGVGGGGPMGAAGPPLLPRTGGYAEQPALAMDAFALFDRWLAERQGHDAGQG